MYQVGDRQEGKCLLCPGKVEVVQLKKDGQTVRLCRKHLWDALQDAGEKVAKEEAPSVPAEKV